MNESNIALEVLFVWILLVGVFLFRDPRQSRLGNILCGIALLAVVAYAIQQYPPHNPKFFALMIGASALGTWLVSARANSLRVPALVALQNGAGGMASMLVSYVELGRNPANAPLLQSFGLLGITVGAVTFSGSLVAGGKLSGTLASAPVQLPHRRIVLWGACAAVFALSIGALLGTGDGAFHFPTALAVVSLILGLIVALPVGGADMPVMISLLNSLSGMAAAFCGILTQNRPLVVCGSLVGASGLILTLAMSRAMNRNILAILAGPRWPRTGGCEPCAEEARPEIAENALTNHKGVRPQEDPARLAAEALRAAHRVVIIPGYGMALAQAQFEAVNLANRLLAAGKEVTFAIHPVAGRMPGHMNVVLAEAGVDYERLLDLEPANQMLPTTDVALVVGACDVVNPAAITRPGTPISGMPVLLAHKAARTVVCNLDDRPGYSGVDNPLYEDDRTILLLGDARVNLGRLVEGIAQST